LGLFQHITDKLKDLLNDRGSLILLLLIILGLALFEKLLKSPILEVHRGHRIRKFAHNEAGVGEDVRLLMKELGMIIPRVFVPANLKKTRTKYFENNDFKDLVKEIRKSNDAEVTGVELLHVMWEQYTILHFYFTSDSFNEIEHKSIAEVIANFKKSLVCLNLENQIPKVSFSICFNNTSFTTWRNFIWTY
jgi:hypothetical protein